MYEKRFVFVTVMTVLALFLLSACSADAVEESSDSVAAPAEASATDTPAEVVELATDEQLVAALKAKDADAVRQALEGGADPNVDYVEGIPALIRAIQMARGGDGADFVELLLEFGADVDVQSKNGQVPMSEAVGAGQLEIVKLLLDAGVDVNSTIDLEVAGLQAAGKSYPNAPLLLHAAARNQIDVIELLIDKGADVNQTDSYWGATSLHIAAWRNHGDAVELLLEHGADPSRVLKHTFIDVGTPVHGTVLEGSFEAFKAFLEGGVNPDIRVDQGPTPMMYAMTTLMTSKNRNDFVALLLEHGADPTLLDDFGNTALHLAARRGRVDATSMLIEHGAPIDLPNNADNTALHFAALEGIQESLIELIEHGADPTLQDDSGNTSLHHAARGGRADAISILLEHGAPIDLPNNAGNTALHLAVQGSEKYALASLIEHGAALDLVNNRGETPLDIAWNDAIVEMLNEAAAALAPWPAPRGAPAMAYDSESDRIIMFGGELERVLSDKMSSATWSYDVVSNAWTQMRPSTKPVAVAGSAMAYDTESDRIIMYGGADANWDDVNSTWAYDFNSNTWSRLSPGPEKREGAMMVYDSESDRMILFGGIQIGKGPFDETWAYDFNTDTWENMQPANPPSMRAWHNMAYDVESDLVILWEGERAETDNVWTYDYNSNGWTMHEPDERPQFAFYDGFGDMAYDAESDRAITFGGGSITGSGTNDFTWVYDYNNNTWTQMEPAESPGEKTAHQMVYNSAHDVIVLYGGRDGAGDMYSSETWLYDFNTNTWINMTPDQE
jgi:ankyrin repeat protein